MVDNTWSGTKQCPVRASTVSDLDSSKDMASCGPFRDPSPRSFSLLLGALRCCYEYQEHGSAMPEDAGRNSVLYSNKPRNPSSRSTRPASTRPGTRDAGTRPNTVAGRPSSATFQGTVTTLSYSLLFFPSFSSNHLSFVVYI